MSRKKISFLIGSLSSGGAERVISTLSNGLIEDYDITIITVVKRTPFYPLDDRIKLVSCFDSVTASKSLLQSILLNFRILRKIIFLIKQERIELAIGFITTMNVLTVLASKFCRIPSIICERNNPHQQKASKLWSILRYFTYPRADLLTVQTPGIKRFYENRIPTDRIKIMPNPISFKLSKQRDPNHVKENIVLNVGRLHGQKDQLTLIKAFANIGASDWKLYIVGEGDQREKLETFIAEKKLREKVILKGQQKNISSYYNKSKIFVLSSLYEGFPNALIEALHFGLPSISTNCPTGPSELIEDGTNGFLIPITDLKALENKLQLLMTDGTLRKKFSESSPEVTKKFELSNVILDWKNIIEEILQAQRHN